MSKPYPLDDNELSGVCVLKQYDITVYICIMFYGGLHLDANTI